jgi:ABC-type lipoprotein release transport system permease subunit
MIRKHKKQVTLKLENAWERIEYGLRYVCGRPSPLKRLITVLIVGGALVVGYVYMLASSIYNIGKRDAQREFLELKPIERLKPENGEIKNEEMGNKEMTIKNNVYEYEQAR